MPLRSAIVCSLPLILATAALSDDAEALLVKMHEAYASAPTMSVTDTMSFSQPGGPGEEVALVVHADAAGNGQMITPDFSMTFLDNVLYASMSDNADKYAKIECKAGNIYAAMLESSGSTGIPSSLVLRYSDDAKEWVAAMGLWILEDGAVESVEDVEVDGTPIHRLTIRGGAGTIAVDVDAATYFILSTKGDLTPPGAPAGFSISVGISSEVTIADALASPVTFDAGEREAVGSIEDLVEPPPGRTAVVKVGAEAPDFTLATLDGESVQLSKLKGNVVVMDFWATWCGPCKMALPMLQEFADWVDTEKLNVNVYAVDIWEQGTDHAAITAKVKEFWTSKKYTVPVLMALDQTVPAAYGLSSIPLTVVVGTDGAVAAVHSGYSPSMVDDLKKDVQAALKPAS